MAKGRISEVEAALAKLQAEYDELQNRFDQLKKNMLSFGGEASIPVEKPVAAPAPKADDAAPKADSKSAIDLARRHEHAVSFTDSAIRKSPD